jgi:hypothetical protein
MNEAAEAIHTMDTNDQPTALPRLAKFPDGQTAQTDEVLSFARSNCIMCYGRGVLSVVTEETDKTEAQICPCASRRYLASKQILEQPAPIVSRPKGHEKLRQSDLVRIERLSREVAKLEDELASRKHRFEAKQTSVRDDVSAAERTKTFCESESKTLGEYIQQTQAKIKDGEEQLQILHAHAHDLLQRVEEVANIKAASKLVLEESGSKLAVAANRFTKDNAGLMKDIERARRRLATAQAYQTEPVPTEPTEPTPAGPMP